MTDAPDIRKPLRQKRKLAFEDVDFLWRDELRATRLAVEYSKTDLILRDRGIASTIVFFGSARTDEDSPWYDLARRFARRISEFSLATHTAGGSRQWDYVVMTGGGPGIMEAANRGASDACAPSVALNIDLPHEQIPNPWTDATLTFQFQYFAMRKMHFLLRARALAIFPGGFGTLDELLDALTLMQTGKMPRLPVLLFGRNYWSEVIDFAAMAKSGMIDAKDVELIHWVDDVDDAWEALIAHIGPKGGQGMR